MTGKPRISLEQIQAAGARIGAPIGEEVAMLLPLMDYILTALDAVPDDRLRAAEPLLIHDAQRRATP